MGNTQIDICTSLDQAIREAYGPGISVIRRVPVSGGDINKAYALTLSDGRKVFMKANRKGNIGFFIAEAAGLAAIAATGTVRSPKVIALGTDVDYSFLLLEHIETGTRSKASSSELGEGLALMHLADAGGFVRGGRFGFTSDNYIGSTPQINSPAETWTDFYIDCRLRPQFSMADGYFSTDDRRMIDRFLSRVPALLTEPEKPSLLHGDLWSGNYMIDSSGCPWLIDPAVYVGHPEVDLAMTELFGGFDRAFYDAYRDTAGIDPGYHDRRDLYNLYQLLNHLNLFGGGYLQSVRSIIRRYV